MLETGTTAGAAGADPPLATMASFWQAVPAATDWKITEPWSHRPNWFGPLQTRLPSVGQAVPRPTIAGEEIVELFIEPKGRALAVKASVKIANESMVMLLNGPMVRL